MALLKLTPEQVSRLWPSFSAGIEAACAPTAYLGETGMSRILEQLLKGEMRMWLIAQTYEAELNKNKLYGHVVTQPVHDWATDTKNLLIFSLYSWELIPDDILRDGANILKEYAKGLGCKKVIAYTKQDRVRQLWKEAFGNANEQTFLEGDVS